MQDIYKAAAIVATIVTIVAAFQRLGKLLK